MPYGKNITKKQFEKLCNMNCTLQEICGFFEVSDQTLNNWCKQEYNDTFLHLFKRFCDKGKTKLRKIQWELAKNNVTMAIWLGKQYLDQKDYVENTNVEKVEFVSDIPKVSTNKANQNKDESE